jgi:hypothetical protein
MGVPFKQIKVLATEMDKISSIILAREFNLII